MDTVGLFHSIHKGGSALIESGPSAVRALRRLQNNAGPIFITSVCYSFSTSQGPNSIHSAHDAELFAFIACIACIPCVPGISIDRRSHYVNRDIQETTKRIGAKRKAPKEGGASPGAGERKGERRDRPCGRVDQHSGAGFGSQRRGCAGRSFGRPLIAGACCGRAPQRYLKEKHK